MISAEAITADEFGGVDTMEPVMRLTRDIAQSARTIGRDEARYLVDSYYTLQKYRIKSGNQVRQASETEEPHSVLMWENRQFDVLEGQVARALKYYAEGSAVGRWSMSICGIGPVIAAGLLAHIDIERCPTVGHIWSFAGLNPDTKWERGQKRPWNTPLKTLCWKAGESFVKVVNNEKDFYGKVYAQRKAEEKAKNEAGEFAVQAASVIAKVPKHAQAAKYKEGRLPDSHIHARAKRYAVKLFLSHWHHVAYLCHFGEAPPKPYIITHGGHAHFIEPPNLDVIAK